MFNPSFPEDVNFQENEQLVYRVVNDRFPQHRFDEDIMQLGRIGLLMAMRTYDDSRGVDFGPYAYKCIYHEIARSKEKEFRNKPYKPIIFHAAVVSNEGDEPESRIGFDEIVSIEDDYSALRIEEFLKRLSQRQKVIVRMLMEGYKYQEIGDYFRISRQRIGQEVTVIRDIYDKYKHEQ